MMELLPGKDLKVVVLEGSLRLSVNDRIGETISLLPGKMIIMKPDARTLPEPVDVDLRNLVKSSALVNPKSFGGTAKIAVAALPSTKLIDAEIAHQDQAKAKRGLIATNLVISGSGTKVTAVTDEQLDTLGQDVAPAEGDGRGSKRETLTHRLDRRAASAGDVKGRSATVFVLAGATSSDIREHKKGDGSVLVTGGKDLDVFGNLAAGTVSVGGGLTVTGAVVPNPADTSATPHIITAANMAIGGGLSFAGAAESGPIAPSAGGSVELHGGDLDFSASGINGANFNGGDANPGGPLPAEGGGVKVFL